jgi:hypothetical protein
MVLGGIATVGLVIGGVLVFGNDDPRQVAGPAPFRTTPLVQLDADRVTISRSPLCEGIDPRQISAAVGGAPETSRAWTNGDRLLVAEGVEDVAHEFGCEYVGADGTLARAWVFAPPVTRGQAHGLARKAAKAAACAAGDGPAFGHPTLALTCPDADGAMRASYRGLFGDAWVVCEVARPAGATWEVTDRAGRWCAGVAQSRPSEPNG